MTPHDASAAPVADWHGGASGPLMDAYARMCALMRGHRFLEAVPDSAASLFPEVGAGNMRPSGTVGAIAGAHGVGLPAPSPPHAAPLEYRALRRLLLSPMGLDLLDDVLDPLADRFTGVDASPGRIEMMDALVGLWPAIQTHATGDRRIAAPYSGAELTGAARWYADATGAVMPDVAGDAADGRDTAGELGLLQLAMLRYAPGWCDAVRAVGRTRNRWSPMLELMGLGASEWSNMTVGMRLSMQGSLADLVVMDAERANATGPTRHGGPAGLTYAGAYLRFVELAAPYAGDDMGVYAMLRMDGHGPDMLTPAVDSDTPIEIVTEDWLDEAAAKRTRRRAAEH